jgi:hypothetical protein
MGAVEQELLTLVRKVASKGQLVQVCTGVAKEVQATTCTVERDGLPTLHDVLLNASDGEHGSNLTVYPAEGSDVVVGILDGLKTEAVLLRCTKVDGLAYKDTQGVEWAIKDGKVSVKNGDYSLKQAFDDLIDAIGQLTVTTGVGPSGIPINKPAFDTVKQNIDKFLSD